MSSWALPLVAMVTTTEQHRGSQAHGDSERAVGHRERQETLTWEPLLESATDAGEWRSYRKWKVDWRGLPDTSPWWSDTLCVAAVWRSHTASINSTSPMFCGWALWTHWSHHTGLNEIVLWSFVGAHCGWADSCLFPRKSQCLLWSPHSTRVKNLGDLPVFTS